MNNDIILEICIAGLNCRAGYATAHRTADVRSMRHDECEIEMVGLYNDIT